MKSIFDMDENELRLEIEKLRCELQIYRDIPIVESEINKENNHLRNCLEQISKWPDGGSKYGQESIKRFASNALFGDFK